MKKWYWNNNVNNDYNMAKRNLSLQNSNSKIDEDKHKGKPKECEKKEFPLNVFK